jgi:serine/threonine-protein kinase
LHDIADARIEIEDAFSPEESAPVARKSKHPVLLWALTAVVGIAAIAGLDVVLRGRGNPTEPTLHLSVTLPHELELIGGTAGEPIPAISPDGQRLVFSAREDDTNRLYMRTVDSPEVVPLPGTERGSTPFFSPNGLWVGFFASGKLKKVSVQGGTPVDVCDAPSNRGGGWFEDGTIVFSPTFNGGLARVSADGGNVEFVTTPDPEKNERTHRWPEILPGGKAAVFTIGTKDKPGNYEDATIAVVDLSTGEVRPVIEGGSIARYSPTGHLIYSRERTLLAVPFDVELLKVTGPPVRVLDGVAGDQTSGAVHFGVSGNATLIYMPAATSLCMHTLVWVDREGRAQKSREVPRCPLVGPKLSPDGKLAAVALGLGPGEGDVWIHDFDRDKLTRVTFHNSAIGPIWTADGTRVAYGLTAGGTEGIGWKSADGADVEQLIARDSGEFAAIPEAWLPEEQTILYSRAGGKGGSDIMALDVGNGEIRPLLDGPFSEGGSTLSPDGKWMAYASDESGRFEVYVRPYPGPGGKWQISTEGGRGPIWSRKGEELFYTHGERMMVVPVGTEPSFSAGTPRQLFEFPFMRTVGPWADYDVSPDGQLFLMTQRPKGEPAPRQINLVTRFMVDGLPQ